MRPQVRSYAVGAACVVYATDLDTMAAFYQHCLGLVSVNSSDGYRVLESDAWTLSLVQASGEPGTRTEITLPALRRAEVPIKLAFPVESIEQVRASAPTFGGLVDSPGSQWTFLRRR
jgi:hypothetical protein